MKSATLSLSYYVATLLSTLIICFAATGICLTYVAIVGWYMSLADIFFLFLDILLLVLFGTALSSIINFFLSTQGQISAVGTIISAGYGFICGAYMPISSFGEGLQKIISFLPGTYGTSLIRNHTMQGALVEMQNQGIPTEVIEKLKDSLDCNLYFFGSQVNIGTMYMILGITILVLIGIYILLNKSKNITVNLEIFQHMRYWRMLTAMVSLLAQSMLGKLSQMEHEKADKEMMSILVLHCIKG